MEKEKKAQHAFIKESNECMLKAAKDEKVLDEERISWAIRRELIKEKKNEKEKALNGEFTRQTAEIVTDESWRSYG